MAAAKKAPAKTAARKKARAPPAPAGSWTPLDEPAPAAAPPAAWQSPPPAPPASAMDDRQYGLLLHLSALAGLVVGFFFLGPLILWLVRKDQSPFIDRHGRSAVNFHLSLLLYAVAGLVVFFIVAVATLGIGALVLMPLMILGGLAWIVVAIVFPVVAGVKANGGQEYRYPLAIRFIPEPGPQ